MSKEYFLNLIAKGKSEQVIDELLKLVNDNSIQNDLYLLDSRRSSNNRSYNMGILSNENYNMENNRINYSITSLLDKLTFTESNPSTQNKKEVVLDIVQLKVFIRDFDLYPKSIETAVKVQGISKAAYQLAYAKMGSNLTLVRKVFQPWELTIKALDKNTKDWNDVLENIQFIQSFTEMMSDNQELSSKPNEEQDLKNKVKDGEFEDLVNYVTWKINHTSDKTVTKQWKIDLELDTKEYDSVKRNIWTSATVLENLQSKWLKI